MTATLEEQVQAVPPPLPTLNITDKTCCVSISFGCVGNSRKVSTSQVEVDTDKSLLAVSKKLLDSAELTAISKHDADTRSAVMAVSLPSLFKTGVYLVPIPAIEKVQQLLTDAQVKRLALIDVFMKAYKERKGQAEVRLKALFNPQDYPSPARVRAAFEFDWQWVSFSTPGKLKEISSEFFKQEQEKAAAHWQQATNEITLLLRTGLKDLVDHMVDRLTPSDDGKTKKFHSSTIENIKEFLANFSIRNVTDDSQLEMIVKSAQSLLSGIDAKTIRTNEAVRDSTKHGFELVKQCLDGLVIDAGSRKIILDDEE